MDARHSAAGSDQQKHTRLYQPRREREPTKGCGSIGSSEAFGRRRYRTLWVVTRSLTEAEVRLNHDPLFRFRVTHQRASLVKRPGDEDCSNL